MFRSDQLSIGLRDVGTQGAEETHAVEIRSQYPRAEQTCIFVFDT